jgi:hypothetical protein
MYCKGIGHHLAMDDTLMIIIRLRDFRSKWKRMRVSPGRRSPLKHQQWERQTRRCERHRALSHVFLPGMGSAKHRRLSNAQASAEGRMALVCLFWMEIAAVRLEPNIA